MEFSELLGHLDDLIELAGHMGYSRFATVLRMFRRSIAHRGAYYGTRDVDRPEAGAAPRL